MSTVKITVMNGFLHNLVETFITRADMSDLNEIEMAADECCGQYLDMYADAIYANYPDIDFEAIAEACDYIVEEVVE